MASVFLNSGFVDRDDAFVSAFDAGLQHGVGLFETMLAVRDEAGARVIHLHEHVQRLANSAKGLQLSENVRTAPLADAVQRAADRAMEELEKVTRLRVRLTVTGGDLNLLARDGTGMGAGGAQSPTLLIACQPATEYPDAMFENGVMVSIADRRVNPLDPFEGHKTLSYWPRLRELQIAAGKRAGEALVFQVTNHLAGGCVSNAFIIRDGVMYTPIARGEEAEVAGGEDPEEASTKGAVMPSPVLPGVVRRWVMDWALSEGIRVERRMLTIEDVLGAHEVLLTNSSWGVLPVVALEQSVIGEGRPGSLTSRLRAAWVELAAGAT